MRTPIFVDENGDLSMYSSVQNAEMHLEPADIRAGIYKIYDADGQRLIALVVSREDGVEEVQFRDTLAYDPDELRLKLVDALRQYAVCEEAELGRELSFLVGVCVRSRTLQWTWDKG